MKYVKKKKKTEDYKGLYNDTTSCSWNAVAAYPQMWNAFIVSCFKKNSQFSFFIYIYIYIYIYISTWLT